MKALKIFRKVLLILLIIIVIIAIIGLLFLKFYPPIGDSPDKEKQKEHKEKTDLYYDKKFHNENDFKIDHGLLAYSIFRHKLL